MNYMQQKKVKSMKQFILNFMGHEYTQCEFSTFIFQYIYSDNCSKSALPCFYLLTDYIFFNISLSLYKSMPYHLLFQPSELSVLFSRKLFLIYFQSFYTDVLTYNINNLKVTFHITNTSRIISYALQISIILIFLLQKCKMQFVYYDSLSRHLHDHSVTFLLDQ